MPDRTRCSTCGAFRATARSGAVARKEPERRPAAACGTPLATEPCRTRPFVQVGPLRAVDHRLSHLPFPIPHAVRSGPTLRVAGHMRGAYRNPRIHTRHRAVHRAPHSHHGAPSDARTD